VADGRRDRRSARSSPEARPRAGQDITFGTTSIGAYKFSSKVFTVPFELLQDQGPGIDIEALSAAPPPPASHASATPSSRWALAPASRHGHRHRRRGSGKTMDDRQHVTVDHRRPDRPRAFGRSGLSGDAGRGLHVPRYHAALHQEAEGHAGRPLWLPGFAVKEPDTINGYRYTINQDMAAMAANAKTVLFGDLSRNT
jgi:hypothetical protein